MIHNAKPTDCCGCTACAAVCPAGCITMEADPFGFSYPKVNAAACIGCGRCEAVCPMRQEAAEAGDTKVYAACAADPTTRLFSTSGGLFSLLARQVFAQGGAVAGAVWDENFAVRHVLAWDEAGLAAMRGAKYVQSDPGDIFRQILDLLKNETPVLFTGTPCQTAGLRALAPRDDRLLCAAIVCHGVPSPAVWQKNLRELGGQVSEVRLRDKRDSWSRYHTCYVVDGREVRRPVMEDPYMRGFVRDLYNRPACTVCPAKGARAYADLTLGDFWGIEKIAPDFSDDKGTSVVLAQTARGRAALEALGDGVRLRPVTLEEGARYNPALVRPAAAHPARAAVLEELQTRPLAEVVAAHTRDPLSARVKGALRRLLRR